MIQKACDLSTEKTEGQPVRELYARELVSPLVRTL